MRKLILICCVVLLFGACKKTDSNLLENSLKTTTKVSQNNLIEKEYSDLELNIDNTGEFYNFERDIKQTIMNCDFISENDRLCLCKGIRMENNHIKGIIGSAIILQKMSLGNKIILMKRLYPNRDFKIYNNLTKSVEYEYKISTSSSMNRNNSNETDFRDKVRMMLIYPAKDGGYGSSCEECGDSSCMLWY
ncbi:MAG: hypothetical protein U0U67_17665 [Chitinophagales bacterium]